MQKVKIVLDGGVMPKKATSGSACYDLYVPEDFVLKQGRCVLDLGFRIQLPSNLAALVKSRSGFASKGMEVTVVDWSGSRKKRIDADVLQGVIDSDYTGHAGVILNVRDDCRVKTFIPKDTRIAQLQIVEVPEVEFEEVDSIDATERGEGGFGHTGSVDSIKGEQSSASEDIEAVEPKKRGRKKKEE